MGMEDTPEGKKIIHTSPILTWRKCPVFPTMTASIHMASHRENMGLHDHPEVPLNIQSILNDSQ